MSSIRVIPIVLVFVWGVPARSAEPAAPTFKVERNLFGSRVAVDARGRCAAPRGQELKVWYVTGFPATLPRFESCTTLSSPTARGEAVVNLRIVGPEGLVREVEGVLDLGPQGKAHQAVGWDDIELPSPGKYALEVEVDGQVVTRLPMRVEQRRARAPSRK
jgi:hypothetical protein